MEIRFEKTGVERKALVAAIGEFTGTKAEYLGAPGFAYSVGDCTVSKDGAVDTGVMGTEEVSALLAALAEQGFVPADTPECGAEPAEQGPVSFGGKQLSGDVGTEGEAAEPMAMAIELPGEGFTDAARLDNLKRLAAGKAYLVRRALGDDLADGAEALPVILGDGKVSFPWFRFGIDADHIAAWSVFCTKLCATAAKQKRVVLKEKALGENDSEKFAMRCFLLKLGFIGEEYKEARRIILAGLAGDGSHKSPKRPEDESSVGPSADYELAEALADAELIHGVNALLDAEADEEPDRSEEESFVEDEGDSFVRGGLCGVPPTDCNYTSYLNRATDAQLREAVAYMETFPAGNKGRIAACSRELRKRGEVC